MNFPENRPSNKYLKIWTIFSSFKLYLNISRKKEQGGNKKER